MNFIETAMQDVHLKITEIQDYLQVYIDSVFFLTHLLRSLLSVHYCCISPFTTLFYPVLPLVPTTTLLSIDIFHHMICLLGAGDFISIIHHEYIAQYLHNLPFYYIP